MKIKFGTDGYRGIVAWDFTFNNVRKLAQAVADFINFNAPSEIQNGKEVAVVGYDRRFLSEKFASDIATILRCNKIGTILLDKPVPTPVISSLTSKRFWIGLMITASHNPPHYNGVKIKINGGSASTRTTKEIESLLNKNPVFFFPGVKPEIKSLDSYYTKYLKSKVNLKKISTTLKGKIVTDYMYGSATGIVEQFFSPKKLISIHTKHDANFGDINPEPKEENLGELKAEIKKNKAILGIAFDGDGDRISLIDEKGSYITPHILSAVLLDYLIEKKRIKGRIYQTISMGYLLKRIAEEKGFSFEEVPVGFKHIAEKMHIEDVLFGAEESGGYAWLGSLPDRDAMLTALMFLEIMATHKKSASQLVEDVQKKYGKSTFLRKYFPLAESINKTTFTTKAKKKLAKKIANTKVEEILDFDGLKVILETDEWFLMRPSGTEPVVRVYAEAETKKKTLELLAYAEKIATTLFNKK